LERTQASKPSVLMLAEKFEIKMLRDKKKFEIKMLGYVDRTCQHNGYDNSDSVLLTSHHKQLSILSYHCYALYNWNTSTTL